MPVRPGNGIVKKLTLDISHLISYNIIKKRGTKPMSAKNEKVKLTYEDKFARHFYCQHARLNSLRNDKKQATRKMRKINKKMCKESLDSED